MKKALLLCASHNDLGLIRALKKLGYYIIATGNRPNLPGQKWCDEFIEADYSNKNLILLIAKEKRVDNVVQCCNDFGVYTATYVSEQLGIPGYDDYQTCLVLHNKDRFKEFCKQNNILSPVSEGFSDMTEAEKYIERANYPIIIKPTDCSAGNGISKAESIEEAKKVLPLAFAKSKAGRIVIEPYITGSQHGFCTFLRNRKVVNVCSNNEYSILNPYRVEIDTYPADNFNTIKDILIGQIEKIASVLKLKDGIFHLQYIYDGEKPMIIEVMRRILGNMYHVPGNALTGIDWEYWETRAKCGLSLDDMPINVRQEGFYAYKAIMADHNGQFEGIQIPAEYERYLTETYMLREKGYQIESFKSDPMGFMFFMFPTMEKMKKVLIDDYTSKIAIVK